MKVFPGINMTRNRGFLMMKMALKIDDFYFFLTPIIDLMGLFRAREY